MLRKTLAFALVVLSALSARGARHDFRLEHDGRSLTGGSVCFYRASGPEFFGKFFASADVHCLPADKLLTIPPGKWRFFGEADGFVSNHPDMVTIEGTGGDSAIAMVSIDMLPAGFVDVSKVPLEVGEYLVFYLSNEGRPGSPASVRPVGPAEKRVSLPADMAIVPMLVRHGRPHLVGDEMRLNPSEEVTMRPLVPVPGRSDLLVVTAAPATWSDPMRDVTASVSVTLLASDGTRVSPLLAVRRGGEVERTLHIFKSVPPGAARIELGGRLWLADEIEMRVNATEAVSIASRPLRLVPGGAIRLNWHVDGTASYATTEPVCDAVRKVPDEHAMPTRSVRLARCTREGEETICSGPVIRAMPDDLLGTMYFESLEPGEYQLEARHGALPVVRKTIEVVRARETVADLPISFQTIRGRVTRDGHPIVANVRFSTRGSGVTDATTGEYVAVVRGDPGKSPVVVQPCEAGSAYINQPEDEVLGGTIYDIAIPANGVAVMVVDARTGMGIAKATVTHGSRYTRDDDAGFSGDSGKTDAEGRYSFDTVSPEHYLSLCAGASGYTERCEQPFRIGENEQKRVTVTLEPVADEPGRVIWPQPLLHTTVFFVGSDGVVLQEVGVAADGSFRVRSLPDGAYAVVVGRNVPLTVVWPLQRDADAHLEIPVGSSGSSSFRVARNAEGSLTPVTLALGPKLVPLLAFDTHQTLRGRDSRVRGGSDLEVRDIAAMNPTYVILGPDPWPPNAPAYTDVFAWPAFRDALPRKLVTGTVVSFP